MGSGPILDPARFTTTANIVLSGLGVQGGGDWGGSLTSGDRILVKNQTNAFDNGVYVASAGAWSRATDMDESAEVVPGMIISVAEGTTDADTVWELSANAPITIGVTNLTFIQIGASEIEIGVTPIIAGNVGAIIFEGSGNVAQQDATKLFWDNTNNRLGVGTNSPSATGHFVGSGATSTTYGLQVHNSTGSNNAFIVRDDGLIGIGVDPTTNIKLNIQGVGNTTGAGIQIKNSDGVNVFLIQDSGALYLGQSTPPYAASGSSYNIYALDGTLYSIAPQTSPTSLEFQKSGSVLGFFGSYGLTINSVADPNSTTISLKNTSTTGNSWDISLNPASIGANYIGFYNSTLGHTAFRGNTSGDFSFGNVNPSARVHIKGSGATSATYGLQVHNSTGSNNAFIVRDDGLIGIGTSSPISRLQLGEITTGANETNASQKYSLYIPSSWSNPGAPNSEEFGDKIVFYNNYQAKVAFGMDVDNGLWFQTNGPNKAFRFFGGPSSTTATEKVTILNSGELGIGISSPTSMLHVVGSGATSATYGLKIHNSTGSNNAFIVRDDGLIGIGISSPSSTLDILQSASSSGTPKAFYITGGAHTSMTASTECIGVDFNFSATKQWATGAITTQREILIQAPTYAFVGASTITDAATFVISGAPIAGTNATITNSYSFWVQSGATRYGGRVLESQGADVASANDLTLGSDGNCFEITGATQINAITTSGWQNGTIITLLFTSTPTVKHNTSGGGGTAVILLSGSADYVSTAGSTLSLRLSEIGGTQAWREVGRAIM
jgi:hypothetical protein